MMYHLFASYFYHVAIVAADKFISLQKRRQVLLNGVDGRSVNVHVST